MRAATHGDSLGGLLCVGFHGTRVPTELRELVARGVRSVVLFSRNLGAPEQVRDLISEIKALTDEPLLVAVDQEGGAVQRLREGFTRLPPMRAIGSAEDPELAMRIGQLVGTELRAVGVDWDFAPVLDVDTNPHNPVIGARAFHQQADWVARLGLAFAAGLERAGVAACGKHFPGHGDTDLDSHLALPRLAHESARLAAIELLPFRAAAQAKLPSLMTAHVVFSELDSEVPATLSPAVLSGLLRQQLGYDGVVISDDLEMRAVLDHFGVETAAVRAVAAGIDALLVCHSAERAHAAIDALERARRVGDLPEARGNEALSRLQALARRYAAPVPDKNALALLQSPEHRALAERWSQWAATSSPRDPTREPGA